MLKYYILISYQRMRVYVLSHNIDHYFQGVKERLVFRRKFLCIFNIWLFAIVQHLLSLYVYENAAYTQVSRLTYTKDLFYIHNYNFTDVKNKK